MCNMETVLVGCLVCGVLVNVYSTWLNWCAYRWWDRTYREVIRAECLRQSADGKG